MSRLLSRLAATTALALAAFTAPTLVAHASSAFDGNWVIDVPSDNIGGSEADSTCPALRLSVQIIDNQVSGNWRRSYPEQLNVVADGGTTGASQVSGQVQQDGSVKTQWQNFHTAGQLVGDQGTLTVQSECGPLIARIRRLDDMTKTTAMSESSATRIAATTATTSSDASDSASLAANSQTDEYNVYFAFDKSRLNSKAHDAVDAAVQATQGSQTSRIGLVGKADLSGTDPYNMALSQRRADTVRDAMVAGGVPSDRIDVRWVGDREPPVATAPGVRDAMNRVVEVEIR